MRKKIMGLACSAIAVALAVVGWVSMTTAQDSSNVEYIVFGAPSLGWGEMALSVQDGDRVIAIGVIETGTGGRHVTYLVEREIE